MKHFLVGLSAGFLLFTSCSNKAETKHAAKPLTAMAKNATAQKNKDSIKTIHVFVALCDNKYQGIVPVGKAIGNGQDEDNNLYWGCDNGLRTFFKKKSSNWAMLQRIKKPSAQVRERILFKHKTENVYLLADAYDGQFIKETTVDFLEAAAGKKPVLFSLKPDSLFFGGSSNLIAYIGHDGLMDFSLPVAQPAVRKDKVETIVLACYSKYYFSPHLKAAGVTPLLWTTGLMAPEAYTLHDALQAWIKKKNAAQICNAAAGAYSRYQKCSFKAAKNLLVWGW